MLSWVLLFCDLKLHLQSELASSILVSCVALRLVQQQKICFYIRIGRCDPEPFNWQFFHWSLRDQLFLFQYWWWESSHSHQITAKINSLSRCCLHGEETLSSQNWEAGVAWRLLIAASVLSLWPREKYKGLYSLELQHKHKKSHGTALLGLGLVHWLCEAGEVRQCHTMSMNYPRWNDMF